MSFRIQPTPVARPNRCQLFGPGSRPAIFEKMAASAADVINLDLEDSVAPSDKDSARKNIIKAISDIDWGNKIILHLPMIIPEGDVGFWLDGQVHRWKNGELFSFDISKNHKGSIKAIDDQKIMKGDENLISFNRDVILLNSYFFLFS